MSEAVEAALRMGYRHIDTAQMYGNHADIGEVFAKVFVNDGLKREDVFVTSKVSVINHRQEDVECIALISHQAFSMQSAAAYCAHES